ncbi:MAG: SurA N-terminal domain-containing protein [Candidatus Binatia bacterium]
MLDFLRKRKRSWIIVFFLFVIIIVFIAFYGGNQMQDAGFRDVATINGEVITQREFAVHYGRLVERYRDIFKGSMTPELMKNLNLKNNLLEELILQKLMVQEARAMGVTVTDDELVEQIAKVPEFQVNGRFNKERYLQLLRANRLAPAQFEEEQRDQLTIQRLLGIVLDSVHVMEAEVRERYRFEQEKINLQFLRLSANGFLSQVKITEDEIHKFYERNKESLKEPLKVQVEYLSYPFEQFASSVQISDKEVEEYYGANRDTKFHTPKQARVRYILLRLAPGADAKSKEAARNRANRIVTEARAGKDFGRLAKQESQDPSGAEGGDLGWITQGQTPANIDKAIFSLAKGEISSPVETPEGFHVVKVEEVKDQETQSLKEATAEITRLLRAEKAKQAAATTANRNREKALSGTDFTKLAKESGATVNVTPAFTSGEVLPKIGPAPEFYKSALSLGVKDVSPVVEGANAYYILKIKDRQEPVLPPLEAVRSRIEKGLKESKAYEMLVQKANSLREQLKKEKDIRKVAEQSGLRVEETGWFLRAAPQIPKIGELQELSPGGLAISAHQPIPETIFTQKDSAFVFAFKGSQGADMDRFEKEKDTLVKQAIADSQQRILQKLKEGLKAKANIQVYAGALEEI